MSTDGMQFKIERGLPAPNDGRMGRLVYPWPDMNDGDCLTIQANGKEPRVIGNRAHVSARSWLKRHRPEWKAVLRCTDTHARIWFVAPKP